MYEGRITEHIEQGRFICSVCLLDKGSRLHLLTSSNRELNLSPKRATLISRSIIDISRPREELLELLRQAEATRDRLKAEVDVEELWELVREEDESFDHGYLANLVFGKAITDDHISALVRALFENRLHFKMKEGRFLPNSQEKIDQIRRQKEEEALKEETIKEGSAWLGAIFQGKPYKAPACKDRIIDLLLQLALHGNDVPDFKFAKELLVKSGITDIRQAKKLLVMLGIWEEDENIDLIRMDIATSFSERQLEESRRLAAERLSFEGREDLRELPTFTIDGSLTLDFDDALSLEKVGDMLHIGIHIADVSESIRPGSILDQEAKTRALSHYLPRRQIPMLPPELSHDALSLKKDCDRPAISLLTRMDKNGNIFNHRFVPSVIRVRRQLTYDEVNQALDDDTFNKMHQIAKRLKEKRMEMGAISLSLPDIQVVFDNHAHENGHISFTLKQVDQDTPSRMIIAEFMILYNWLAGRFCRDREIPSLFRTQPEPNELISSDDAGYIYYVFKQRRKLRPLHIDTTPAPHSGLGLDAYIHATSPIRRYIDLVTQRQIKSFIMDGRTLYDKRELEEIKLLMEPLIKESQTLKRNRLRYWILKFLSLHSGEKYRAVILDELRDKYRIVLTDFLIVTEIKRQDGFIFKPGEEIMVEVKRARPWDGSLDLIFA